MKYASEYKCRECGKVISSKPREMDTKELAKKLQSDLKDGKAMPYWVHICDNGSIGFCDFQGHKAVKA